MIEQATHVYRDLRTSPMMSGSRQSFGDSGRLISVDVTQEKQTLRAVQLRARSARPAADLAEARSAICAHVVTRCAQRAWGCVAAYEPLRTEPGSTQLLNSLATLGVRVLVPVLLPDRDLDWR